MSEQSQLHKTNLRQPIKKDIDKIYELLTFYARDKLLLSLAKKDIEERLNTFIVAVDKDDVIGCASIKDYGDDLYEIRSLAVKPGYTGERIGTRMVRKLIAELKLKKTTRIFALTYRATFFEYLGFYHVDKELFPQKIWDDCSKCPKQDDCDEEALMLDVDAFKSSEV